MLYLCIVQILESGLMLSKLRAVFLPAQKEKYWYPYPCVLAIMAHKLPLVGLNNRTGGYFF
jgi:hypothetical protein